MKALIYARKAKKTEKGWLHPTTGLLLVKAGDEREDVFCLYAEDSDTDSEIICFVVNRSTLENVERNIHRALTQEPVSIRRVEHA